MKDECAEMKRGAIIKNFAVKNFACRNEKRPQSFR